LTVDVFKGEDVVLVLLMRIVCPFVPIMPLPMFIAAAAYLNL
jgi:hypothetical protein